MKYLYIALLTLMIGVSGSGIVSADSTVTTHNTAMSFIDDMSDAPLMNGITLIDGAGFVFEQQNGRIVEKIAAADIPVQDILDYYTMIMPQLGWSVSTTKSGHFIRDTETFSITIKTVNDVQLVTFRLQPL